jgi:hypothetical protein
MSVSERCFFQRKLSVRHSGSESGCGGGEVWQGHQNKTYGRHVHVQRVQHLHAVHYVQRVQHV